MIKRSWIFIASIFFTYAYIIKPDRFLANDIQMTDKAISLAKTLWEKSETEPPK